MALFELPPLTIVLARVGIAALVLIAVIYGGGGRMLRNGRLWRLPMPGALTWASLGGLAVFSTALAYVIYFRILATAGATNLLLVTFLIPVSAILLGVAVLGERLELGQIAGMALIALGLAAIDGRLLGLINRADPKPSRQQRSGRPGPPRHP